MSRNAWTAVALFGGVLLVTGGLGTLLYVAGRAPAEPPPPEPAPVRPLPDPPEPQPPEPDRPVPPVPAPTAAAPIAVPGHPELDGRDWKAIGEAFVAMAGKMRLAADAPPAASREALESIQRAMARFQQLAFEPSEGEPVPERPARLDHPAFAANLALSALDALHLPLTDDQARRLGELARERSAVVDATDPGAPLAEGEWKLERLAARAESAERFYGEMFAALTPAQAEALAPDPYRGRVRIDVFSAGLVWMNSVAPVRHDDSGRLAEHVANATVQSAGIVERQEEVRKIVEAWAAEAPSEPGDALDARGFFRVSRVTRDAARMLDLLKKVVSELALPPEAAEKLRMVSTVWVPVAPRQ